MDDSAIKARIKARREALGLSQEDMAERLGIVRNTYANIERQGGTKLTIELLGRIAMELSTSAEELFLGYRPCHPADRGTLEEAREGYLAREKSIKDDYEDRLAASRELIDALKNNIVDLKRLLDEKEQQIAQLKKRRKS